MTQDKRQLISDNHNLIYQCLHSMQVDIDDWYDVAAIAVCKNIDKYDATRGQLSTFFNLVIRSAIINEYAKQNKITAIPQSKLFSYNAIACINDDGDGKEYLSLFESNSNPEDFISIYDVYVQLNSQQKIVLQCLLNKYTRSEIGEVLGLTRSRISQIIKEIRHVYYHEKERGQM